MSGDSPSSEQPSIGREAPRQADPWQGQWQSSWWKEPWTSSRWESAWSRQQPQQADPWLAARGWRWKSSTEAGSSGWVKSETPSESKDFDEERCLGWVNVGSRD